MKCYDTEKYIMKYLDEEMTKQEAEELKEHIQHCPKCRESFLFYDNMIHIFEEMPLYEAPEDFEKNVMVQIQALQQNEQITQKTKNKIIVSIWGIFAVLFGTGAVLAFYKESIIKIFENTNYFHKWVVNIIPIEQNIAQQGQTLQLAAEHITVWADRILTNSFGVFLFLLCVVCAIQYFIFKQKMKTKKSNRWYRK